MNPVTVYLFEKYDPALRRRVVDSVMATIEYIDRNGALAVHRTAKIVDASQLTKGGLYYPPPSKPPRGLE
jgi:hypothetical protein